jgi:hypothetical protein
LRNQNLLSVLGASRERLAMYSAERCRAQLAECHNLLPLAQSKAESTVLTTLIRSWKMIANQMDRYEVIMIEKSLTARK